MLTSPVQAMGQLFLFEERPNVPPRYNIAPTQDVLIIRLAPNGKARSRQLVPVRWGLVPFWSDDAKIGYKMINARAETVDRLPAYRDAFKRRRCLIPADGFFEWRRYSADPKAPKQPHLIRRQDRLPFAFAGLWDAWRDRSTGQMLETCTIITTTANRCLSDLHHRMPVILAPDEYGTWLEPTSLDKELLGPCPEDWLDFIPISNRINRPANDDPACLDPAPMVERQASLF